MTKKKTGLSRGVLNKQKGSEHFQVSRYEPSDLLKAFIEHYWIVHWDVTGRQSYQQQVLSHPSVHLVFEQKNTKIWGVVTKVFTRLLTGKGHVVGVKFKPAGFYPFYKRPVSGFTDQQLSFGDVFTDNLPTLEREILAQQNEPDVIASVEEFITAHSPQPDHLVSKINAMIDEIMKDPAILKVDDLVDRFGITKRTLQRHFNRYVGVHPKWVIQRYRLQEAAEKIASGESKHWAELALSLGYFDQAHFIRDFKAIVGTSPAEYAKSIHS